MEKRIKILHGLTIGAILAFCTMQSYWLYHRYSYTLETHENELYETVLEVMQEEREVRKFKKRPDINIVTNTKITASTEPGKAGILSTVFDIYAVDLKKNERKDITEKDIKNIIRMYRTAQTEGITHYRFDITNHPKDPNEYDALERFIIDFRSPFKIARVDSLLRQRGITAKDIHIERADSMVWLPLRFNHTSTFNPHITISYPYDIFEREMVNITLPVELSPVLSKMMNLLLLSIVLSVFLISCLVAQIATIQKQRKVEELRQDFIHTMIHELKRPISTLKMCISFMRNDKLMEDKESKEAVLADSRHELNNLSSYFSKLRDLTFNDVTEIPLTLSAFDLRSTITDCIEKLSIPSGKTAAIHLVSDTKLTVTADKMHLSHIISNLLENAIKYSEKKVEIKIGYCENNHESIAISVQDNGFGISKSDRKYIFDKFFRSPSITDRNIPGMGLGLAYVKQLVTAHKGSIEVESEEGAGTVFTIKLPQ